MAKEFLQWDHVSGICCCVMHHTVFLKTKMKLFERLSWRPLEHSVFIRLENSFVL